MISTPICDFLKSYAAEQSSRFHMPGHKGTLFAFSENEVSHMNCSEQFQKNIQNSIIDCMEYDITEISGADSLYEASGIIKESENIASFLFGTGATYYSTEGSSQCIRAMLALVSKYQTCDSYKNRKPVILAARNVHRTFITAAALLDLEVHWIFPETENHSLCSCLISADSVREAINALPEKPCAVYLTSPDYLGNIQDVAGIASVVHEHGIPLLVDNAHGAYLHFMKPSLHPIDLGADICCDSAHKTLPALTGCAYLHLNKNVAAKYRENAKKALGAFGSTSPSYLLLQSLDLTNAILSDLWEEKLFECIKQVRKCKERLNELGWHLLDEDSQNHNTEPLKITINTACHGYSGKELADYLRSFHIECEYADPDYLVLMVSPCNKELDFNRLLSAMEQLPIYKTDSIDNKKALPLWKIPAPKQVISIREALFSYSVNIPVENAIGRICADSCLSCPPAIPIIVCGEEISGEVLPILKHYGIFSVAVVFQPA